jgi:uncharacterized protein YqgC (DUF456 family)
MSQNVTLPDEGGPRRGWRELVRIASGIGLVLLGIVGIILPIMPGWIFLIPGLLILGEYYPPAKSLVEWSKAKFAAARAAATGRNSS